MLLVIIILCANSLEPRSVSCEAPPPLPAKTRLLDPDRHSSRISVSTQDHREYSASQGILCIAWSTLHHREHSASQGVPSVPGNTQCHEESCESDLTWLFLHDAGRKSYIILRSTKSHRHTPLRTGNDCRFELHFLMDFWYCGNTTAPVLFHVTNACLFRISRGSPLRILWITAASPRPTSRQGLQLYTQRATTTITTADVH